MQPVSIAALIEFIRKQPDGRPIPGKSWARSPVGHYAAEVLNHEILDTDVYDDPSEEVWDDLRRDPVVLALFEQSGTTASQDTLDWIRKLGRGCMMTLHPDDTLMDVLNADTSTTYGQLRAVLEELGVMDK